MTMEVKKSNPFSSYVVPGWKVSVVETYDVNSNLETSDFVDYKDYESDDANVPLSYAVADDIISNFVVVDANTAMDILISFINSSNIIDKDYFESKLDYITVNSKGTVSPSKFNELELAVQSKPHGKSWVHPQPLIYTKNLKYAMHVKDYLERRKNEKKNELYIIDEYSENKGLTESAAAIEDLLNYNIDPEFINKLTVHENFTLDLSPFDLIKAEESFDLVYESKDVYGYKIWYAVDESKEGLYLLLKESSDSDKIYGIHLSTEKQIKVLTEKFTMPETFSVRTLDFNPIIRNEFKMPVSCEIVEEGLSIDSDGNVKVTIGKKKSYMDLYAENHRILMHNVETDNKEGIKTNLASAFALISMIEQEKKYIERDENLVKARAFLINDFKTYLKKLQKEEPDFDFAEYYASKDYDKIVINVPAESISGIKKLVRSLLV